LRGLDAQGVRRGELRLALHDLHFSLLREPRESLRELADDSGLPAAERLEAYLRLPELDPGVSDFLRFGEHPRDVKQRLGRDAAVVEAYAAQRRIALDQHDLLAEVGGAERRGIAAGTGTEHQHFGVYVALRARVRRRRLLRRAARGRRTGS